MMIAEEYLSRSRVFRRLKNGSHGQLLERYATRLAEEGLAQEGGLRCLSLVGDLMKWIASSGSKVADIDERMVERYLRNRARKHSIHPIVRPALKRFLSVLRNVGMIAPAEPLRITQQDQILAEFSDYQQRERGLAPRSIVRHLPVIRRFLCEVCPANAVDLGKIDHADVVHYVERHARDGSPDSAKLMCWSLRAFLRYLHHKGLNRVPLAGCVPSIRQWKFANLPTYLSAEQVQKVLDGCDRSSALERRDYAILMMLAKLGLRANEVATLTLDDIDWRSGEMFVRAKGRQRARMPIPPDVGAAVVAYLRGARPKSITTKLAVKCATLPPDRNASWVLRLAAVRGFARHVASLNPKTEVPPPGILQPLKRPKPHVYSNAEINALLAAALALPPADGLRRWTYHCFFGLLAVTGLRLSEAIGLQRDEVDLKAGVLTVRQSKFGKSRLVPLHLTACAALRSYSERRDAHLGSRCGPHFFVAQSGGRLPQPSIRRVFMQLSREIGLRRPGQRTGPRIHDIRHRFAIRTLVGWYREGTDVEKKLPALSTYLGHTWVRDTYWYLSACPELMQEAARRLDRRWEAKP